MVSSIFSSPSLHHVQITTAVWHLFTTFLVLFLTSREPVNLFTPKHISIRRMLPICVLFASYLILGNLSLTYNPVSMYQLAKILTVPCVVLLSYVLFRTTVSQKKLWAVFAACVGVGLATANSPSSSISFLGGAFAVASFTSTALYQIWIGKSLTDQHVSPPQLLMNQAPLSMGMLLLLVPMMDTLPSLSKTLSFSSP